jgi:tetratricopeptide (TPR) repeat protein/predicted Ser/Thr protein kinase
MIGQTISHYRIVEKLGSGGMGVVYKAEDTRLDRAVALKFLPEDLAHDSQAVERFRREAHAASALNHPSICTIYDIGEQDGKPFIAMEFIEGQTLRRHIGGRPLPLDEILDLGTQIADALDAAHSKGIIHRDIKPANIFVTDRGQAKVLDFGLAKLVRKTAAGGDAITSRGTPEEPLSIVGIISGTPSYMSPEQVRGDDLDTRTDLFSLGLLLYEMATGKQAFTGNTGGAIIEAVLSRAPAPPESLNPDIPPKLGEVISKALEKDRNLRYQSAKEIRADLQRLKRDTESMHITATMEPIAPRARRMNWAVIAGAAVVVIALAAGGWFYMSRRGHALTETDTIVLADFANSTGDPVFDDTLKQALATELQQSPFLTILPDQRVSDTLKLMGRPADTRLDEKTALEVCQRSGSKAVMAGSIASLGSQYVIGLHAVNCQTGNSLAREAITANKKEEVLNALDKAATKLREQVGESLSTIQKFDTPVEQATTPSLEALQAYSLGRKALQVKGDYAAAISLFQRAIQLDPNFAMAYASMGTSYNNLGETNLAAENTRKAYELRERVSEREKFYIESHYHEFVTGDLEKARQVYELWEQTYPRDDVPPNNLGNLYHRLGQYDKSLAEARERVRLTEDGIAYSNLFMDYVDLNRFEEARATAEEASKKGLDSPSLHFYLYRVAFLQNDAAGMTQQVAWGMGKPGEEDVLLYLEAETAAYSGQLGKARELSRRAVDSAERAQEKEAAANYEAGAALREALFGNGPEGRKRALSALALSNGRDAQCVAALALAFAGEASAGGAQAPMEELTGDLAKRFPEDTIVESYYLPTIRARLALSRSDASKAIDWLRATSIYEIGSPGATDSLSPNLYPVYVRGEAYLAGHQGKEAAAEFQRILDHSGIVGNEPIGALAHLGLARAYALQGDTAKARAAYQDFLTLWKDADPDIPILQQAKAEFAKLK